MKRFIFIVLLASLIPLATQSQTFDPGKISFIVEYKKIDNANPADTTLAFADSLDLTISWDAVTGFGIPSDSLIQYDESSGWTAFENLDPQNTILHTVLKVDDNSTYSFRVWSLYSHSGLSSNPVFNNVKSLAPSDEYVIYIDMPKPPPAVTRIIRLKL